MQLNSPLSPGRGVRLLITGRRRSAPWGETLGLDDLLMLKFAEATASRQIVQVQAAEAYQLQLSGAEELSRLDPAKLPAAVAALLGENPSGLIFLADDGAQSLAVSLGGKAPQFDAEIQADGAVQDDSLNESYRFSIAPQGREIARLRVRFSQPRSEPIMWSIEGEPALALTARQLSERDSATSGSPGPELWEVVLPTARSSPFVLQAARKSTFKEDTPLALASLVGADTPTRHGPHWFQRAELARAAQPSIESHSCRFTLRQSSWRHRWPRFVTIRKRIRFWLRSLRSSSLPMPRRRRRSRLDLACPLGFAVQPQQRRTSAHVPRRKRWPWKNRISAAARRPVAGGLGGRSGGDRIGRRVRFLENQPSPGKPVCHGGAPMDRRSIPAPAYLVVCCPVACMRCSHPLSQLERGVAPRAVLSQAEISGLQTVSLPWTKRLFGPLASIREEASINPHADVSPGHPPAVPESLPTKVPAPPLPESRPSGVSSPWKPDASQLLSDAAGWTIHRFDGLGDAPGQIWVDVPALSAWAWSVFVLAMAARWTLGRRNVTLDIALLGIATAVALLMPAPSAPISAAAWLGLITGASWCGSCRNEAQSILCPGPHRNPTPQNWQPPPR